MTPFAEFDNINGKEIYNTLSGFWESVQIHREPTYLKAIHVPIYGKDARLGAAIFFATLAYPNDVARQESFVQMVIVFLVKSFAPHRSEVRKKLRENPSSRKILDTPNKRVQQTFSDAIRRLHKRNRAAWVLFQKLSSNPNPAGQSPVRDFMIQAASQNTHAYPAFFSTKDNHVKGDTIPDSFRRQVLQESKPVIHLAMALYNRFETGQPQELGLTDLILSADKWLKQTLIGAEMYRVYFGDLFPRYDTQYKGGKRAHNFSAPMNETISVLPFIDPVHPYMNFQWFIEFSRSQEQ